DLYALGATKDRIKAGIEMTAEYRGNPADYTLDVLIENGIAVYNGAQYHTGKIDLRMWMDSVHTEASINSDFLKGSLRSNASLQRIDSALTHKIKRYFAEGSEGPVLTDSVK